MYSDEQIMRKAKMDRDAHEKARLMAELAAGGTKDDPDCVEAPLSRPVGDALYYASDRLGRLEYHLATLFDRLRPVLAAEEPRAEHPTDRHAGAGGRSEVAESIGLLGLRADGIADSISALVERLEV